MKHDLFAVACGVALFLFTVSVAGAQVCPADAGNACDSSNDADLCTDGVIVCTDGVPSCEQEGARIWLPADEGSGAVLVNAADAPRQAEAAVGAAVTWTTGDVGLGVLLDSTLATSWLRVPKAEAVSQGPWTWSFKVLSTGSSGTVISRTSLGQFDGFRYQVDGTVTLEGTDYASTPLPVGFWRHITIVLTSTHLKIYHDGSLVDDFAIAAQPTSWVSDIWFGQDQDSNNGGFQTSDAFSGILDDIVYYPRALSAPQVLDLYGFGVTFQQMHRELCDGVDNDCNPSTPDPKNTACDGPDSDLCQNGVTQCSGGFLGLTTSCGAETITDQIEICNFLDDDCDGVVDNGTGAGLACDGPDIDQCTGGRFTCNGSGGKACGAEPVFHYDFDTDIAGARTVYDATSWNHEAVMFAGAQYSQDGQSGRALDLLGGTDSLVRIHNTDALRVSEWAFSAWIRPSTDAQGTVLYQRSVFSIWRKADGSIAVSRGQLPTSTAPGLGQVIKGQWTHLTVSVDEGLATVYINGVAAGSTALNNLPPVSLITHPVSLGCTTQTRVCQVSEFVGQLDEVNFFNRPLNASEVASLHANGATWFVPSREQCGVADGNCDGATATTAVGCTSYFRDGDSDGWGADTIGYMRPTIWWSMDEVSADGSLTDWSKNSVPLRRIGGSRRVLGYRGLGLEFDGTDRKVGAETAATVHSWASFGEEMTLSSWIYPHATGIGVVTRTIAGSLANTWRLVINNSGKLQFRYAGININGPSVTLDSWQQVGITIKGTTLTFYRNGLPTAVHTLASPLSVQHGLSIGNRAGTGYQPFDGVIDEVILFARELTGPEMSTLFTADDHACLCGADSTHKVTQRGDCADDVFSRNPAAAELCDTLDTDCNGTIDDIVSSACTPNDPVTACTEGITACVGGGTSCIGRPASYHSFDEGTGFIAYNQVEAGHSMSADYSASALWQPGSTGQAVELVLGNRLRSGKYDFSSGGAVSFRWRPEPPLLDTGRTLAQFGATRDVVGIASAEIRLTTAGFRVRVQGIDVISEPYNEWVVAGQWHHLVFTWDESGASDSLSLWIDGLLVKTVTVDLGQIDFINLGSSPAETIGLVDDLVVYERDIPAALIRQLSSIGLNGSQLNRELCDGKDNDCDGITDEDDTGWANGAADLTASCDTADIDQCTEGAWRCAEGNRSAECVDGPVGYWSFENTDLSFAADSGGDSGNLAPRGSSAAGFNGGNAASLPVASTPMKVATPSALHTDAGTVSMRVKSKDATFQRIAGLTSGTWSLNLEWQLTSAGAVLQLTGDAVSEFTNPPQQTATATIDTWYTITLVWNRADDRVAVYLDGVLLADYGGLKWPVSASMSAVEFGTQGAATGSIIVDDLAIYRRALNPTDVANVHLVTHSPALNTELCDAIDNDCDAATDEGFSLSSSCDSTQDVDLCDEGSVACNDLYASSCSGDGPVVAWLMDEATSIDVLDYSGARAHGVPHGTATSADGKFGKSRKLANNAYIAVQSSGRLASQMQAQTIALWMRPTTNAAGVLIHKPGSYGVMRRSDGSIAHFNASKSTNFPSSGLGATGSGDWTHIAVVWNGSRRLVYSNGVLVGATDSYSGTIPVSDAPIRIGCRSNANGECTSQWFSGRLDEVLIYDYALTATEVSTLVTDGLPAASRNAPRCGQSIDNDCDGSIASSDTPIDCTLFHPDSDSDGYGVNLGIKYGADAYWGFDSVSGASIPDDTGLGNDLLRVDVPAVRIGVGGYALELSQSSQPIEGATSVFTNASQLTMGFRVYPRDGQPGRLFTAAGSVVADYTGSAVQITAFGVATTVSGLVQNQWNYIHYSVDTTAGEGSLALHNASGSLVNSSAVNVGQAQPTTGASSLLSVGTSGTNKAPNVRFDDLIVWRSITTPVLATATGVICDCSAPTGMVSNDGDCKDGIPSINPGASEVCDGVDQNCNGVTDESSVDCDDSLACTQDQCLSGSCANVVKTGTCLIAGTCHADGDLNPANSCQRCSPSDTSVAWTQRPDGSSCNDGDACTTSDTCTAGACSGSSNTCDDGNACTTDSCNSATGCTNTVDAGKSVSCYTGPAGTSGVGLCNDGIATCAGDGSLGTCQGEVIPTSESCDGADNNCDGAVDEAFNVGSACDGNDVDSCSSGTIICDGQFSSRCINDGEALRLDFEQTVATTATPNQGWAGENAFLQSGALVGDGKTGFGKAALLDGTNDFVQWTEPSDLDGTHTGFSFSTWMKRDNAGALQSVAHHVGLSGTIEFALEIVANQLRLRIGSEAVDSGVYLKPGLGWIHIAVVVQGSDVRWYVDGLRLSETAWGGSLVPITGSKSWFFSSRPNGSYTPISGGLDEIRLAATSWNDTEVLSQTIVGGEVCSGADTNCDGVIDEGYSKNTAACDGPDIGECTSGTATACTTPGHGVACIGDGSSYAYSLDTLVGTLAISDNAERWIHMGGAVSVTGQRGAALQLDGTWPGLLPRRPSESRTVQGTFAAWVKFDSGTNGRLAHWKHKDGSDIFVVERLFGQLRVATAGGSKTFSSTSLTNGAWLHIAVITDNGQVTAYVDAVSVGSYSDNTLASSYALDGVRTVGGSFTSAGVTAGLQGQIDDLIMLDPVVYSQAQLASLVTLGDACNGIDDDCDGTTDEGFEQNGQACVGGNTCVESGTLQCNTSATALECIGPFKPSGTTCDDGDACTSGDSCDSAGGCSGSAYTCDDSLACTTDTCNGDGTCTFTVDAGFCLIEGVCVSDGEVNSANPCELCASVTAQSGWSNRPDGTACDDSSVCTTGDACGAGTCAGTAITCDDGDDCTVDGCDPILGCQAVSLQPDGTACDDAKPCTVSTVCTSGLCLGGAVNDCDDGNKCTFDSCNPASGCVNTVVPFTETCYDGPAGTKGVGQCVGGTRSCSGDTLGPCVGQVVPQTELCDALDNNCDGVADEPFTTLGNDCDGPDADACANGTVVCSSDKQGIECSNDVQQSEICDQKDNDCDGQTDEDFPGLGLACDGADSDQCAVGILACDDAGGTTCVGDGPALLLMGEEPEPVSYVATDLSGNGNSVVRHGELQTSAGNTGNAYTFDGIDDRLSVSTSTSLAIKDKFTVAVAFNLTAGSGAVTLIESSVGDCVDLGLRINPSGGAFALIEQSKCGFASLAAGTTINYGTWHHLAITADGTTFKLYLDGVLRSSSAQSGAVYQFGALEIGSQNTGASQLFKGQLDDIQVWSVALDGAAIATLASSGVPAGTIDVEICNGVDDDCSGTTDEHAATEVCDGVDNDCDGTVDNGFALGAACDDADADLCSDGLQACPTWGSGSVGCYGDNAAVWYQFAQGTGNVAYDFVGTGHATLNGATWTAGATNGGISVGAQKYMTLSNYDGLATNTGESTIEARVRYTGGSGQLIQHTSGLGLAIVAGELECRLPGAGTAGADLVASAAAISLDTWMHTGCVYDRGALRLYIDGALKALTRGIGTASAGAKQLIVGNGADAALDDIALFDVALSASTILDHSANGIAATQIRREICDSADNDCDSTVDEGFEQVGQSCDIDGDGCSNGTMACVSLTGEMSCLNDTPENGVEICNGLDDNCDGATDETFQGLGLPCDGPDADECALGTVVCSTDQTSVVCVGDTVKTEICNGIDDDCDGVIDEGFDVGQACDGGDTDACLLGLWACRADNSGRYCSGDGATGYYPMLEGAGATIASSEGDVPAGVLEGTYTWLPTDTGATGSLLFQPGAKSILGAQLTVPGNQGAFGARVKIQPGSDTHLYLAGSRQLVVVGDKPRCAIAGLAPSACTGTPVDWSSGYHDIVCVFSPGSIKVYVDGALDAECSGTGTPSLPGTSQAQIGALGSSTPVHFDWFVVWNVAPDAVKVASRTIADICDGIDNDCDGSTDTTFPTKGASCDGLDADLCTDGTLSCTANGLQLECTGETNSPDICNGLDDDCDGSTDEDFPTKGTACDGPDADQCTNGTLKCTNDGSALECIGDITQAEICDGKDNDCNGITDDQITGLGGACDGPDADLCTDGVQWCDSSAGLVACDEIGAVVYLQLDESSGTAKPVDSSRFQRDFTSVGSGTVTFGETGQLGTAAMFQNKGFRAISGDALNGLSAVTLAAWVKPNATAEDLSVVSNSSHTTTQVGLSLSNTSVSFHINDAQVSCDFGTTCLDRAEAGVWTHIAAIYDSGTVSFFIDGKLSGRMSTVHTQLQNQTNEQIRVGRIRNNISYFSGALDEVMILPRALSRSEVVAFSSLGPSADAIELCDQIDNDCDGTTDEGFSKGSACDGSDPDQCATGTTVCSASGNESQCQDGLMLLHYEMNDPLSVRLHDLGSSRRDLFLEGGVTSTTGVTGNAWTFDGVKSKAEGSSGDLLGGKTGATFAVWMRPSDITNGELRAIASQYKAGTGATGRTWALIHADDGIALRIRGSTDTSVTPSTALCSSVTACGAVLQANTWTHIVVAFDSGWVRFYADGAALTSFPLATGAGITAALPDEPLMLGAALVQLERFQGTLDDFRLYDAVLSPTEIARLYHQSQGNYVDLCDGTDDDCDGLTDEDHTTKGQACDGPDADQCKNGIWACRSDGFGVECPSETSTDVVEICNALDDDCDGQTDEDFAGVGQPCDGADADSCMEGVQACSATGGELVCLRDGPTGLWRFDEGAGVVAGDSASSSPTNDLTLSNVFFATGKFGQALEFGGSGGIAKATLAISGTRTLMMWLKVGADGTVYGESESASQVHFTGRWASGALIHQQMDGSLTRTVTSNLAANEWHHVAVVMEPGKTNGLRLYVDCVEAGSTTLNSNVSVGEFNLGRAKGIPGLYTGFADELAIFPYVVPAARICEYVASGIPGSEENRELCDTLDNDCDGDTDEGLTGTPSAVCDGPDSDLCTNGTWTCRADKLDVECTNETTVDIPEVCNEADDDCDGITDEGFAYEGIDKGFPCDPPGACGSGVVECVSATAAGCSTGPGGSVDISGPEFCDGVDNDCDGLTDEKPDGSAVTENCYTGPSGTLGVGECKLGKRLCTDGAFGDCLDEVTPTAADTTCNQKDEDCDGVFDEDYDDGVVCTVSTCIDGVISNIPDNSLCDDNNPCTDNICTVTGCTFPIDNSNVPDQVQYGKECQLAYCESGVLLFKEDDAATGDDGLSCTSDGCLNGIPQHVILDGTCLIGNNCFSKGDTNPDGGCDVCMPQFSKTEWSDSAHAADFDEGVGGTEEGYVEQELAGGSVSWSLSQVRALNGIYSLYFGNPSSNSYDSLTRAAASMSSTNITLVADVNYQLSWYTWMETEAYTGSDKFDTLTVDVIDTSTNEVTEVWNSMSAFGNHTAGIWKESTVDLTPWAGKEVQVRWTFDSGDAFFNDYEGVYLDKIRVKTGCCFFNTDCTDNGPCEAGFCSADSKQCNYTKVAGCGDCVPQQATVVLAIDRSISMQGTGATGETLLSLVRTALSELMPTYESRINLGVKLFPNPTTDNACAVTTGLDLDFHSTGGQLDSLLAGVAPDGQTALGAALAQVNAAYDQPAVQAESGNKFVIVITDGSEQCAGNPAIQLAALGGKGIRHMVVGFDKFTSVAELTSLAMQEGGLPRPRTSDTDPVYIPAGDTPTSVKQAIASAFDTTLGEMCNGLDDNCDGDIDTAAPDLACNLACKLGVGGTNVCENGQYKGCNESPLSGELCNGEDDDCDGTVDEDFPLKDSPCSTGVGACFTTGVYVCHPLEDDVLCNATAPPGSDETCNDIDDDCDGTTDEELVQACSTDCGTGTEVCQSGAWVNCSAIQPIDETCNGLDDNCNGVTDDVVPQPCTGACGDGFQQCANGQVTGCSADGAVEICNGVDDDCDGLTDEDVNGNTLSESCTPPLPSGYTEIYGDCAIGSRICGEVKDQAGTYGFGAPQSNGTIVLDQCVAKAVPKAEACNALDDDCDGSVDNISGSSEPIVDECYDGAAGTAGIGICKKGTLTCLPGGTNSGVCEGQVVPATEVCNGLDDDCDGQIDEDPALICLKTNPECAVGACLCASNQAGEYVCYQD